MMGEIEYKNEMKFKYKAEIFSMAVCEIQVYIYAYIDCNKYIGRYGT